MRGQVTKTYRGRTVAEVKDAYAADRHEALRDEYIPVTEHRDDENPYEMSVTYVPLERAWVRFGSGPDKAGMATTTVEMRRTGWGGVVQGLQSFAAWTDWSRLAWPTIVTLFLGFVLVGSESGVVLVLFLVALAWLLGRLGKSAEGLRFARNRGMAELRAMTQIGPAKRPPKTDGTPTTTPRREQVPAGLRFDVFQRDGFRCRYCGRSTQDDGVKLHADHVVPIAIGGLTTLDNLVTSCQDCNLGKRDKTVV